MNATGCTDRRGVACDSRERGAATQGIENVGAERTALAQVEESRHKHDGLADKPAIPGSLLTLLVDRADIAVGFVELPTCRLRWCSRGFHRRIERFEPGFDGVVLDGAASALAEWVAAHAETLRSTTDMSETRFRLVEGDDGLRFRAMRLTPELVGVSLHDEPSIDDTLVDYLRLREGLFSTSRRITVSEMASALAHEINQPVGALVNLLSGVDRRLRRGDSVDERIHGALERALEQAWYTSRVIARIRDFTDARRPRRDAIDLPMLLRAAIDLLDWLFEANRCRVTLELPSAGHPEARVIGDETMLQQVFVNLLRNAVEAMRATPLDQRRIKVSMHVEAQRVAVEIEDRGHGLSDDEPFLPLATSKPDGMGIGLHICRSFVELHQGRVWLSQNRGPGCTAHTSLPRCRHEADEVLE